MATNPYLPDQAQAITNQVNNNLQQQVLPGINAGAMAAGGYGGSRQGIAQGLAIGQTNQGLSNSLANLYGNAYAQDQQLSAQQQMHQAGLSNQLQIAQLNDATQRLGLQNQYNLGLGNLGLGFTQANQNYNLGLGGLANQQQANQNAYQQAMGQLGLGYYTADQSFYNNQRAQDLQALGLGAGLIGQGNLGLAAGGQGLWQAGQQGQNAALQALQQYAGLLSPFTGLNQSSTQTQPGASTVGSALGGALTAAQLWKLLSGGGG